MPSSSGSGIDCLARNSDLWQQRANLHATMNLRFFMPKLSASSIEVQEHPMQVTWLEDFTAAEYLHASIDCLLLCCAGACITTPGLRQPDEPPESQSFGPWTIRPREHPLTILLHAPLPFITVSVQNAFPLASLHPSNAYIVESMKCRPTSCIIVVRGWRLFPYGNLRSFDGFHERENQLTPAIAFRMFLPKVQRQRLINWNQGAYISYYSEGKVNFPIYFSWF